MRRMVGLAAAVAALFIAAGCLPAPPPGWTPPVVTAEVSPTTVVAGGTFTVVVTATDPEDPVTSIDIRIRPPQPFGAGDRAFPNQTCEPGEFTGANTSTRTFECVMPELAPNGQWRLRAWATNAASVYQGTEQSSFEVTGGSDDQEAPALDSVVVSPYPVIIGEPFSVTIRASDDNHLPPSPTTVGANIVIPAPPEGSVSWTCSPATPTVADPTVLEWHFTDCLIPAGSSEWTYAGSISVEDAIGYTDSLEFSFPALSG